MRDLGLKSAPGTLLYQELNLAQRVLRDLVNESTNSIRIDSLIQFDILKAFGAEFTPSAVDKLGPLQGRAPHLRPVQHRW